MLTRRIVLLSAWTLAASPGPSYAQASTTAAPAREVQCALAVARLRRGEPLEQEQPAQCGNASGSLRVFQAASLSKPVVATLVLRQVQRGELGLDQPVQALLPQGYAHRQNLFALRESPKLDVVPNDVLRAVTVRHLLSHTSGLPNWSDRGPLRLVAAPGTTWLYSGEGYVLLQHILQVRTGLALNDLAASEIFEPLGLRDSAFKLTTHIESLLVPGRSPSGQVRQLRFPYEIGASSLYTSASDYARFMAATLADRSLLRLVTSAPASIPHTSALSWGLGWGIERTDDSHCIWHWGRIPGFRSLAMADLNTRNAVVVLTASEDGMGEAMAIAREYLPGTHPALELALVR